MLPSDLSGSSMAVQHTGQLCSYQPGDVDMCGLHNCISVHAWLACTGTDDPDPPAGTHQNKMKTFLLNKLTMCVLCSGLGRSSLVSGISALPSQHSGTVSVSTYLIFSVWMLFTICLSLVTGTWSHPWLPASTGVYPAQPSSPPAVRVPPSARAWTPPASAAQQWSDSYTEGFQACT